MFRVCFVFFFCFVFWFSYYVKEVWPEAPSDEQCVTRAECFRKRRGTGWQPVQWSCSQSHWPRIWAFLQETALPNLRNVQVSQKQGTVLKWLWTFAVPSSYYVVFFYLDFVGNRCSNLEFCRDLCVGLALYLCAGPEFRHGSVGVITWGFSGDFTLQKGK